jgi:vesicular inhibitory amino acid transporter
MHHLILTLFSQACCIEYLILESDNLSKLFPNVHISIGSLTLNSHVFFAILTTLVVMPTTWLRDLTCLSYISGLCSLIASIVILLGLGLLR